MSSSESAAGKQLDIRKYPNRRYYDSTHSRHLTLEEIRGLIREGYDIKVTDSKTGADLTAQVLTQIILELETPKIDSFPVALLLRMIRSNDQVVRDFVENYFNQAFRAFVEYQKQMEERLRQMQMPGLFPPFNAWAQAWSPFVPGATPAADESAGSPSVNATARPGPSDSESAKPGAAPADVQRDMEELRAQLAALRAGLRTAPKTKQPARKKRSRK